MKIFTVLLAAMLLCGSTALSASKLTANPTSLDFTGTKVSPSAPKSYVLHNAGPGVLHPRISPSAHTEISLDNSTFVSTAVIITMGNGADQTVYVRVVTSNPIVLNETITNTDTSNSGQAAPVAITGDVPLPITLTSFKLDLSSDTPLLTWKTISEIDNYGFYVQKSQDMTTWTEIANSFQQGYGTTTVEHYYSFSDNTVPAGKFYRLHQVDLDGTSHYSDAISSVVSTVEPAQVVKEFALQQNYPNPFNPTTSIKYTVGGTGGQGPGAGVKLTVYNLLGQEVAVLVNEQKAAGSYEVSFNASGLASGIYIYRLTAGSFTDTRRMVLMK